MWRCRRILVLLLGLASISVHAQDNAGENHHCERLKLKAPLTYTQEKAPRDLSTVLPVVVEKVNRVLEGVVDVEVEWEGGDLHGRVGEHTVRCKVTRLVSAIHPENRKHERESTDDEGRRVIVQCFHIPFTILDTNECTLPSGHPMRHQCHAPSICINTIGSYECLCPLLADSHTPRQASDDSFWVEIGSQSRSAWELSFNTTNESSCPSSASTHGCCAPLGHTTAGSLCRSAFRCPVDPCTSGHDCAPNARCERDSWPQKRPNFKCECPAGLMGNGHKCRPGLDVKPQPKVKFDGVTPTEDTLESNFCDCTKPIVDACAGFPPCVGHNQVCIVTANNEPKCACKPGFVDDDDGYGCVDETPPVLRLRHDPDGDQTLRLKQGDVYKEYAVDIIDENAEDYARSLRITYSQPLPPGCLANTGRFHVNYTVATPWTSPPYVRITRNVIIEDINECTIDISKYERSCPELIPQCDVDAGATCVNTIGSYTCRCPDYTSGDGFKPLTSILPVSSPDGYRGGTGCVDTSKPVITILGPNPKVLKVCKCGGLTGIMGGRSSADNIDSLCAEQRKRFDSGLKELISSTSGAELCATHYNTNPVPTDCVKAVDYTYKGPIDLSSRVIVGEPIQKSPLRWSVPYNVIDDAANEATTMWRDVIVEEVDLFDLENKIRAEIMEQKEERKDEAAPKAVVGELAANEQLETAGSAKPVVGRGRKTKNCPPCQKCDCPVDGSFNPSQCDSICARKIAESAGTCVAPGEKKSAASFPGPLQFLEDVFPPEVLIVINWCVFVGISMLLIRWVTTAIFNPRAYTVFNDARADEAERAMQNAVTYFRSPGSAPAATSQPIRAGTPQSAPAVGNLSFGGGASSRAVNGIFSPQENRLYGQDRYNMSPFWSPPSSTSGQQPSHGTQNDNVYDDSIYQGGLSTATPLRTDQPTPYNLR